MFNLFPDIDLSELTASVVRLRRKLGLRIGGLTLGWRDVALNALWQESDNEEYWVNREFLNIKTHKAAPDSFERKLLRRLNGQTARFEDSNSAPLFDPLQVTPPKLDLVVYTGQIRIAELVVGKSSQYFTFYAAGTSTAIEQASDDRLGAELFRVSMITDGYSEAAGIVMRFAGKFPTFMATATITEGGVFDLGEANKGTMLFRVVFPQSSWLNHVQGRTFVTLSESISQISIKATA